MRTQKIKKRNNRGMGHTYSSIFHHLVWSTKERLPIIKPTYRMRLYDYIGGIIKTEQGKMLTIGGTSDHIHLLVLIAPKDSISDLVRRIKSNSSKFINKNIPNLKFAWQEGYGVFSVSASKTTIVKNYINNQETHHKKYSFKDEFIKLLEKHNIEYDEQYLFT